MASPTPMLWAMSSRSLSAGFEGVAIDVAGVGVGIVAGAKLGAVLSWATPVGAGIGALVMAQARRSGKHIGRPARRKFHADEIGRMRVLRCQGVSIRKLAIDFDTTQWMAARLTGSGPEQLAIT